MSRTSLIVAAIVIAVLAVYEQVRKFDFIVYDDPTYVTENPHVKSGLTSQNVAWAFTTFRASNWHPLTWMSHMADAQLFGLNSGRHHAANAILHLVNSLLLFGVLVSMTQARWRSGIVALLFAVHPLHVESVAWVSERKDTLSTCLGLLALWAYVLYVRRRDLRWLAATTVLLALGLMAKPMLVTWPFLLLLLDCWPLDRWGKESSRKLILEKLPLLAIAAGGCISTIYAQARGRAISESMSMAAAVPNAFTSYVAYLVKTFVPVYLGVGYPHPAILGTTILKLQALGAAALLIAITMIAWKCRRRFPYVLVGWLWYLGTLVPVIGFVQVGTQGMADRYTYVPLIGIFIAIVWGAWDLTRAMKWPQAVGGTIAALVVLACVFVARRQASYWTDTRSLFEHSVAVIPNNYIAHGALGIAYAKAKEPALAMSHFQQAVKLNPEDAAAHNSIGNIFLENGRPDLAVRHFETALNASPDYAEARNNLGNAYDALGKSDQAIEQYSAALRSRQDIPQAHHNLGRLLGRQGKMDEAIAHFREAVRLDPNYANAHFSLALALALQGQDAEAAQHDRQALKIRPDWPDPMSHLAWLLATSPDPALRQPAEAVQLAERASILTGNKQTGVLDTLGAAYAAAGKFHQAVDVSKQAFSIAESRNQKRQAQEISQRIKLYESGKPYVAHASATRPTAP